MFTRYVSCMLVALLPAMLLPVDARAQVTNLEYELLIRRHNPTPPIGGLLNRTAVPVRVGAIDVSDTVRVGEEVPFAVQINAESATLPLEAVWTMGDGASARGLVVRHAYSQPGDYEVRLRVSNRIHEEERVVRITALPPEEVQSTL